MERKQHKAPEHEIKMKQEEFQHPGQSKADQKEQSRQQSMM
jgi:hypothetical protein